MGGLLFQTQRMSVKEFKVYLKHLAFILHHNNISFQIPKYFTTKEDFGDLDILIPNGVGLENIKQWFKKPWYNFLLKTKVTGLEDWSVNGDVISIKYKNFQIDFIRTKPENWETAYNYFSWNDLGNLIDRLAYKFGLKYGFDGLTYPYNNSKNQKVAIIPISKDINDILRFLDLDVKKFHQGFNNLQEIFEFVIASKYFNPYIYDLKHLNKINRDRDKKCKTYQLWLKYIEPLKPNYPSIGVWFEKDKKEWIPFINEKFPKAFLIDAIAWIEKLEKKKEERNTKFNGKMVIDAFPNQPKEVGKIINAFKEYACKKYICKDIPINYFDRILDSSTAKEIKILFDNFIDFYKNKKI
jgi:hypothetical protein